MTVHEISVLCTDQRTSCWRREEWAVTAFVVLILIQVPNITDTHQQLEKGTAKEKSFSEPR